MSGITDLTEILATMAPTVRPGRFVFVTTNQQVPAVAMVAESEGPSLLITEELAQTYGLDHEGVFGWITLEVHSALASVGLTAAVATTLAEQQIPCNVIAGRYHDHLLVPIDLVAQALAGLQNLASRGGVAGLSGDDPNRSR